LFWEKPRWGGRVLGPLLSTRLDNEGTVEEEGGGAALGRPRDGEGKLGSDTAGGRVGKLLMGSLTGPGLEYKLL
jgi:hypothetical protein